MDKIIDLFSGYKKIKALYYIRTNIKQMLPNWYNQFYKNHLKKKFNNPEELEYIYQRVNYYNKLQEVKAVDISSRKLKSLSIHDDASAYHYDTVEYTKYFDKNLKINTLYNDIIHIPDVPSILKSRPICDNNTNSIILNLDKHRHFLFIKDKRKFSNKKDKLIGIGMVNDQKALRVRFLEMHFNNPLCDIGHTNDFRNNLWKLDFVSIYKQLQYKFILCWEGNDVATNLKYVMSSNSLAICTKPKYETWFMEGKLVGGVHYVEIKDDFSDLNEKIEYYSKNIEASEKIIANANAYVKQFQNKKREDLISLLVLEKYFTNTGQLVK